MYENIRVPPPPRVVGGVGRSRVGESGRVGILVIVPVVAQFSSIGYLSV